MDFEWWRRPRVSRDRQMELAIVLHLPLSHGVSLNVYYLQYKAGTVPVASRTPERTVQPNFHHLFHFRVDTTLAKTYHILSKHLCIDHNLTNHRLSSTKPCTDRIMYWHEQRRETETHRVCGSHRMQPDPSDQNQKLRHWRVNITMDRRHLRVSVT